MLGETVARRYAAAIFALAKEAGTVDAVGRDLHAALDALTKDDLTRRFFVSPVIDRAEKGAAIDAALKDRVGDIARHSVLLLVRKRREALLRPIVAHYDALALAQAGLEPLEIVSARPLTQGQAADIVARLARVYGKSFKVTQRVDPALLGGVRVRMGDAQIDGTIKGRLDELARELVQSGPQVEPPILTQNLGR